MKEATAKWEGGLGNQVFSAPWLMKQRDTWLHVINYALITPIAGRKMS